MDYKLLNTQKKELTDYINIKIKYGNKIDENGKVKFLEIDFKSILSIIFGLQLHLSELVNQDEQDNSSFFSDKNYYFNISKEFGSHLIENLEGFNLEWFNEIKNQSFILNGILGNENLSEFVEETLINQMNIRQWEFGKFFFDKISARFTMNNKKWLSVEKQISRLLKKDNDYWTNLSKKINELKSQIEYHEAMLLYFLIKNEVLKNEMNMLDYFLVASYAMNKMHNISLREKQIVNAFDELLSLKWGQNRGMGGPKR